MSVTAALWVVIMVSVLDTDTMITTHNPEVTHIACKDTWEEDSQTDAWCKFPIQLFPTYFALAC